MNTSALITRLLHLAARPFVLLLGFLKKVALAVFGRVQWSPPRWLSQGRAVFSRFNRAHPLIAASGILAILLLFCACAGRCNCLDTAQSRVNTSLWLDRFALRNW